MIIYVHHTLSPLGSTIYMIAINLINIQLATIEMVAFKDSENKEKKKDLNILKLHVGKRHKLTIQSKL